MTLSEKQQLFTVMVANLIQWAEEHGYRLTFGEAYRTPEQAALNAKKRQRYHQQPAYPASGRGLQSVH
ncbi:hypothetical protein ACZ87_00273 [Candidatus Erwinia dacicola]|uniref:M15 family peptidase n=1 Tax=Candidatus Erwinia dacicola TaxID=252393 RepID=A0A328TTH6_9GAMM|nr:hypothetical protein ACZ87_00273 [Candidatus Erwinia dacicola]